VTRLREFAQNIFFGEKDEIILVLPQSRNFCQGEEAQWVSMKYFVHKCVWIINTLNMCGLIFDNIHRIRSVY
jgi:hypothetical protein